MKLYDIYQICKQNIGVIEDIYLEEESYNQRLYEKIQKQLSDKINFDHESAKELIRALKEVRQIACLRQQATEIIDLLSIGCEYVNEMNEIYQEVEKLEGNMKLIIRLCESMNLENSGGNLNIRIPRCRDFEEYISYIRDLNFILYQCPFLQKENEEIKFKATDVGSMWLNFVVGFVGTSVIFTNLAVLLDKAISLKSHLVTVKQQQELLEAMRQKNEIGQEVIGAFKIAEDVLIKKYVKEMEEEIGELKDGEEREKAERSLEKLSDLLNRGVEIYTSIDAPKEVQVLFPVSTKTDQIEKKKLDLIEQNADSEN